METMIFWGFVLVFALCSFRMKFVEAFGLMIASMMSLYLAFWQANHYTALSALVPIQYEEYVNPCLILALFSIFFFLLRLVFRYVYGLYVKQLDENNEKIFSRYFQIAGTLICNALTGIVVCSLFFLLAAVVPLTSHFSQISVDKLASEGKTGVMFVSAVVDTVSLQSWRLKDKEILMKKYLSSDIAEEERALQKKMPR